MTSSSLPSGSPGEPTRDEQLSRLIEEAEQVLASGRELDVTAFVSRAPSDLETELRELLQMIVQLRARESPPVGVLAGALADMPLERVAHYRILREIGRGGMGVVYLAHDEQLDRRVALKVLPGLSRLDPDLRERFARESKAVARLVHPNIIPLYEAGEADAYAYLAMQYVEGKTLDALVREWNASGVRPRRDKQGAGSEASLTFAGIARIIREIALALDHAHAARILHRDVKAANVILDATGRPWILDFGVCRFTESDSETQTGSVLGTLRTMAPEQIEGQA
ncbi:MAG: serine/threonine-protein kinase, partial [Planctomycetota bacterium]